MKFSIRLLYLYLFSFVGLLITVFGAIRLVDLGMKIYVFGNADRYEYYARPVPLEGEKISPQDEALMLEDQKRQNDRQRKRTAAEALAMIVVGTPLYLYHWKLIGKEGKQNGKK